MLTAAEVSALVFIYQSCLVESAFHPSSGTPHRLDPRQVLIPRQIAPQYRCYAADGIATGRQRIFPSDPLQQAGVQSGGCSSGFSGLKLSFRGWR